MVLRGTALIQSVTLEFSIHGSRNDWHLSVTGPGGLDLDERETKETSWYPAFTEMLGAGYEAAIRRRFPARAGAGQ